MSGYDMYINSLGLGGAEGRAAAEAAFRAGPGYQWQVDQATRGAQRAANAVGSAPGGGNAMDAVTRLASNLANQEYGNWQQNLQGFQGAAERATGGRAAILQDLANLYQNQGNQTATLQTQQGRDLAGIQAQIAGAEQAAGSQLGALEQNRGTTNAGIVQQGNTALATNATNMAQLLANLQSQYGLNQTNLATQYGGARAGLATTITDALAAANNQRWGTTIQAGQQGMMAGQQAAANRMGAIMGGLQLGAQILGAGMGLPVTGGGSVGGNMLSSLFGKG
jgi:hypothetical protein